MPFCLTKHSHPSKSEALDCDRFLSEVQARRIKSYRVWPSIELHIAGKKWKSWKADIEFYELDNTRSIYESKGRNRSDGEFLLKLSACLTEYPDLPVYVNWHNYLKRERARFTPSLRLMYSGISRAKKKKWIPKTFDHETRKWVPLEIKKRRFDGRH